MIAKLKKEIAALELEVAFLTEKRNSTWWYPTKSRCIDKIYAKTLDIKYKKASIKQYAKAFADFTEEIRVIPNLYIASAGYDDNNSLWLNSPDESTRYFFELPKLWDLEFTGYDFMGYLTTYGTIDLQPALEDIAGAVWIKKETTKKKGSK